MALSKVSLGAKQISYIRDNVKAIVEKLMETSVTNALDKKAEWTKQIKDVEDAELKQAMKNTLRDTKGKHGRRTFQQEEQSIDDILIADDRQALKEAILISQRHGTRIRNRIYQGCTHPFSSSRTAHVLFLIHPCHLHFPWQRVQV